MRVSILILVLTSGVISQECQNGKVLRLSEEVKMKCKKGVWVPREKRAGPGGPPCADHPMLVANGTCSANAEAGHCNQFSVAGQEMDRHCPGTCNSCDGCRCMDSAQWHPYCSYWTQYCDQPGVLGNWMTTNCRKTCNKCSCKCCSYQGKQHALGARILLPDVCGALVCEEGLQAGSSPLLPGAVQHAVTHPEELTLTFLPLFPGRECCLMSENSTKISKGSMVQEGWKGSLRRNGKQLGITCSHGSLYVALEDTKDLCTAPPPPPCPHGTAGDGICCLPDKDGDGVAETSSSSNCSLATPPDNCPDIPNSGQEDFDNDGEGDACDTDADGDTIANSIDNCPLIPNTDQKDTDNDKVGDACDNCINVNNPRPQRDTDSDGVGDACETDKDGDGLDDAKDNCPNMKNAGQEDADGDGVGDVCDNCKDVSNSNQTDTNNNMVGDACDNGVDTDHDGVPDDQDNCKTNPNADQLDTDSDGKGDACDDDADNDTIRNADDNCYLVSNRNQADADGDGVGDACQDDCDADGVKDSEDVCRCDRSKSVTDFQGLVAHNVGISGQSPPIWEFSDGGKQIKQTVNSLATLAIGDAVFSSVRFTGTLFVDDESDNDVAGFVFNYQDNKNFYVISSSKDGSNQGTWSLKRVNSNTGHPSNELQNAMFNFKNMDFDVAGQTKYFELSPDKGWKAKTPYSWTLEVDDQPNVQNIMVEIWEGATNVVNKTIADTDAGRLAGGRLGVYCQSQEDVVWSKMSTQCL